jgi:hypothetical protein
MVYMLFPGMSVQLLWQEEMLLQGVLDSALVPGGANGTALACVRYFCSLGTLVTLCRLFNTSKLFGHSLLPTGHMVFLVK